MIPLSIPEAARIADCSINDISRAITKGELNWKRFRSHPATTREWLKDWKAGVR